MRFNIFQLIARKCHLKLPRHWWSPPDGINGSTLRLEYKDNGNKGDWEVVDSGYTVYRPSLLPVQWVVDFRFTNIGSTDIVLGQYFGVVDPTAGSNIGQPTRTYLQPGQSATCQFFENTTDTSIIGKWIFYSDIVSEFDINFDINFLDRGTTNVIATNYSDWGIIPSDIVNNKSFSPSGSGDIYNYRIWEVRGNTDSHGLYNAYYQNLLYVYNLPNEQIHNIADLFQNLNYTSSADFFISTIGNINGFWTDIPLNITASGGDVSYLNVRGIQSRDGTHVYILNGQDVVGSINYARGIRFNVPPVIANTDITLTSPCTVDQLSLESISIVTYNSSEWSVIPSNLDHGRRFYPEQSELTVIGLCAWAASGSYNPANSELQVGSRELIGQYSIPLDSSNIDISQEIHQYDTETFFLCTLLAQTSDGTRYEIPLDVSPSELSFFTRNLNDLYNPQLIRLNDANGVPIMKASLCNGIRISSPKTDNYQLTLYASLSSHFSEWFPSPDNDDIINRITIDPTTVLQDYDTTWNTTVQYINAATMEPNEPNTLPFTDSEIFKSIWYEFTPTSTIRISMGIDITNGSKSAIVVYKGDPSDFGSLTRVDSSADSWHDFTFLSGTTYFIQAGIKANEFIIGECALRLRLVGLPPSSLTLKYMDLNTGETYLNVGRGETLTYIIGDITDWPITYVATNTGERDITFSNLYLYPQSQPEAGFSQPPTPLTISPGETSSFRFEWTRWNDATTLYTATQELVNDSDEGTYETFIEIHHNAPPKDLQLWIDWINGYDVMLNGFISGLNGLPSWSFGDGSPDITSVFPVEHVYPSGSNTYTVSLSHEGVPTVYVDVVINDNPTPTPEPTTTPVETPTPEPTPSPVPDYHLWAGYGGAFPSEILVDQNVNIYFSCVNCSHYKVLITTPSSSPDPTVYSEGTTDDTINLSSYTLSEIGTYSFGFEVTGSYYPDEMQYTQNYYVVNSVVSVTPDPTSTPVETPTPEPTTTPVDTLPPTPDPTSTPSETPPVTSTPEAPTPTPEPTSTPAVTPTPIYQCHAYHLWGSGDPGDLVSYGYTDCGGSPVVVYNHVMTYSESQGIDPLETACVWDTFPGSPPYVTGNVFWGINGPC